MQLFTRIVSYLINHDEYGKCFSRESDLYDEEMISMFVSLLCNSHNNNFSFSLERIIKVMSELGFLNHIRFEQYLIISELTEKYHLVDERSLFQILFKILDNSNLSFEIEEHFCDQFGTILERVIDGETSKTKLFANEDLLCRSVLEIFNQC